MAGRSLEDEESPELRTSTDSSPDAETGRQPSRSSNGTVALAPPEMFVEADDAVPVDRQGSEAQQISSSVDDARQTPLAGSSTATVDDRPEMFVEAGDLPVRSEAPSVPMTQSAPEESEGYRVQGVGTDEPHAELSEANGAGDVPASRSADGQATRVEWDARGPVDQHAGAPREFESNAVGAEYGHQVWDGTISNLPTETSDALRDWTQERGPATYRQVNGYLRGYEDGTPEVVRHVDRIDDALATQPCPEDIVVTRQTNSRLAFDRDVAETGGTIQSDRGYLATTLGPRGIEQPTADTLVRLHVPAGADAIYLGPISEYPAESELLLARDSEFLVKDVRWDGSIHRWVVNADLLPRNR